MTPTFVLRAGGGSEFSLRTAPGTGGLIFEALGLQPGTARFGRIMPEDFLGRVTLALALAPVSAAQPRSVVREPGRAIRVTAALDEGYLQRVLHSLHAMALQSYETGMPVEWNY